MNTRRRVIVGNNEVLKAVEKERAAQDTDFEEEFVLDRDGDLPLRFWGDKIGSSRRSRFAEKYGTRGTEVNIYVTSSGKLVTEVRQWQVHKDVKRQRRAAESHTTPAEALAWLKQDANGVLGPTSKKAWIQACEAYEPLGPYAAEEVE